MRPEAIATLSVVLLVSLGAAAQGGSGNALLLPPLQPPLATPIPVEGPPKQEGDIITLTSGKVLKGMQVLRMTASTIYIEVLPTLEPLELLRKLVKSVEYDDIDPIRDRRRGTRSNNSRGGNIRAGEAIAPQLHEKLTKPLRYRVFTQKDFREILMELAKEVELQIIFDEGLERISTDTRAWTVDVKQAATVDGILRGAFQKEFPGLDVLYQFDKVFITEKEKKAVTVPGGISVSNQL